MEKFVHVIDSLSTSIGKAFAWCILIMTFGTTYEVVARYVFRAPTLWSFDMSYILYGTLFMMAGAYTLSRDGHVRGDVIYRLWPPRMQATIELVLIVLFLFPGMAALVYAGANYAADSWGYLPYGVDGPQGEISINSPAGVPIAPVKTLLPIAAGLVFIQGLAEVARCIMCLRDGRWPPRMSDVEELEKVLLEQAAHEREEEAKKGAAQQKGATQ